MSRLPEDLERLLHDLRGPLNALSMHAEVLKRAVGDDAAAAASARTIQQEAERLSEMLIAAMAVVVLERTETTRLDLRTIVEEAIAEGGLKDVVVMPGAWPEVDGDRRLLVHAVEQIVRNAVEATEAAGPGTPPPEVSSTVPRPDRVAIVVRDYGRGLRSTNPKVLIRLLASTKPGHRGLGLVGAERVARLHGGSLGFESPGQGARVTLLLSTGDRA